MIILDEHLQLFSPWRVITMRFLIFLILLSSFYSFRASAAVIINEVMANAIDEDTGEFIELYNTGDEPVDVKDWTFTDGDATDIIKAFKEGDKTVIPPKGYGVILDSEYAKEYDIPPTAILLTTKNTTLGDELTTNDQITLLDKNHKRIDTYSHPFNPGNGISVEKIDPLKGDTADNWKVSSDKSGSTPGRKNSPIVPEPTRSLAIIGPDSIEVDSAKIFLIEMQINGVKDVNWKGQVQIETDVPSTRLFVKTEKSGSSTLALKLKNGTAEFQLLATEKKTIRLTAKALSTPEISAQKIVSVQAIPPSNARVIINEIMYAPDTKTGYVEWVEIYNPNSKQIDLSGWQIADATNKPVAIPKNTTIAPKGFLILTKNKPAFLAQFPKVKTVVEIKLPALNNTGDTVIVMSRANKTVDVVKYESKGSTKGRSLERLSTDNPSASLSNWRPSIDVSGATPGRINSRSDLIPYGKPGLKITPNTFNPKASPTKIEYRTPTDSIVTIKIFDSAGKLTKTLLEKREAGGKQTIQWDGTDERGNRVPVGVYICQIIAAVGGGKKATTAKATIVVAEKL